MKTFEILNNFIKDLIISIKTFNQVCREILKPILLSHKIYIFSYLSEKKLLLLKVPCSISRFLIKIPNIFINIFFCIDEVYFYQKGQLSALTCFKSIKKGEHIEKNGKFKILYLQKYSKLRGIFLCISSCSLELSDKTI
ncbi:unnamed protein product [Meganyctiphanes norvegica]|uniref:Uncharacterized protein n=1 Tax=Meganyctiphanes norvegica TaxID=48144 RepID=A0AAV2RQJ3_MEGNR